MAHKEYICDCQQFRCCQSINAVTLATFCGLLTILVLYRIQDNVSFSPVSVRSLKLGQPFCPCSVFANISNKKRRAMSVTPPWTALLNKNTNITTNRSTNLFVWSDSGSGRRLGNQLFIYASLYGVAWRNGRIPLWPDEDSFMRRYFNMTMPIDRANAIRASTETRYINVDEPGPAVYNKLTESLPPRNVSLRTYLQSWRYFIHAEDQLRQELTFKDHIIQEARSFINSSTPPEWRGINFVRVVIHVRRGDHTTPDQQRNGWPVATAEYFNKSMNCFTSCFERVQFIVLSEEIDWCSNNIVGPHVVFSRGRQPIVDMAIASLCDHAIITIGSFGIWCSWFTNGVTITQKNVPIPGSPLTRAFHREDYYKPSYIGL